MNVPGVLYIPVVDLRPVNKRKELSTNKKAVRERRKRRDNTERKLFVEPLKLFLAHKYTRIYGEYMELYNLLKQNHPNSKDFTKTKTFKSWLSQQPKEDILSVCMNDVNIEREPNENGHAEQDEQQQQFVQRQQEYEGFENRVNEIEEFENRVNQIINDLQVDEDLRMYLNDDDDVNDDEGIDLDPAVEIEIEPFDFELEVENGLW